MGVSNSSSFAEISKKLMARARDIKDRVEAMRGKTVVVGIPQSARYPNGKSVAEVAEKIEFGLLENGKHMSAGPRPFMRVAADNNKSKWGRMLQDGVRKALRQRQRPNLRPVLIEVGEQMQSDIKKVMREMDVYDTGRMYNSISILRVNDQNLDT